MEHGKKFLFDQTPSLLISEIFLSMLLSASSKVRYLLLYFNLIFIYTATWHRVRMPANQKRHQWPTFFTLSPESSLFQIKDFAWNKDNYQKRLIEVFAQESQTLGNQTFKGARKNHRKR